MADCFVQITGRMVAGATLRGAVLAGTGGHSLPDYIGPYDITPRVAAQTLLTAGKKMNKDVQIAGVPIYEVSNESGGRTVYIAHEAELEVI